MQSLPPTSFAPQPIKIKPLPLALPPPSLPPVRDITPPPPVVELDEAAHANEIDAAPPSASRYPRPTWPWAAALVSLGAAAGFAISILTQVASGVATDDAQLTSAPVVAAQAAPQPEAFAAAGATHALRAESQPKTLRFDTPLDIRVHAGPAEGPPKNAEVAPKPKPVAAPAAPAQAPAKAPEPPKAAEREPENTFVRAPTRPAPRRDLPPQAVDALVREQLSTALR
jgi:hypothetical protein